MQKSFFLSVIIIFTCVFYFGITNAQVTPPLPTIGNGIAFKPLTSTSQTKAKPEFFGGKIQEKKAIQVKNYESAGYKCTIPAGSTTIEITPKISYGTSFFIPLGTYSRTGYAINSKQHIMGIFNGSQNINCKKCDAKGENCVEVNFKLPIVTMFGNSAI